MESLELIAVSNEERFRDQSALALLLLAASRRNFLVRKRDAGTRATVDTPWRNYIGIFAGRFSLRFVNDTAGDHFNDNVKRLLESIGFVETRVIEWATIDLTEAAAYSVICPLTGEVVTELELLGSLESLKSHLEHGANYHNPEQAQLLLAKQQLRMIGIHPDPFALIGKVQRLPSLDLALLRDGRVIANAYLDIKNENFELNLNMERAMNENSYSLPITVALGTISVPLKSMLELRTGSILKIRQQQTFSGALLMAGEPIASVKIENEGEELLLTVQAIENTAGFCEQTDSRKLLTPDPRLTL
jgi:hypothetical protein